VLEDGSEEDPEFWTALGGTPSDVKDASVAGEDKAVVEFTKTIYRLSDATGGLKFEEIASGRLSKDFLDSSDVFFIDIGIKLFCWVGSGASAGEKKEAMIRAENFLASHGRPSSLPITRIIDGAGDEGEEFNDAFEK
jgi:gelsolin